MEVAVKLTCLLLLASSGLNAASVEELNLAETSDSRISTDVRDTKFFLYSRAAGGVDNPEIIAKDFDSLASTSWDSAKKTFVLMHGFASGEHFAIPFVEEFLLEGDYNIITVEWAPLADGINYIQAAKNSVNVGDYAGELLADLMTKEGLNPAELHLIGHSLGAQAMGHCGRKMKEQTGRRPARLTALDPAFPWYGWQLDQSVRLSKEDADFVDVIHTNSGHIWQGCLSYMEPLGHVDFYPSGGSHQPGCDAFCVGNACSDPSDLIDFLKGGCSHKRSHDFYVESINGDVPFASALCDSYETFKSGGCNGAPTADMGHNLDVASVVQGSYYLDVNAETPYAQG